MSTSAIEQQLGALAVYAGIGEAFTQYALDGRSGTLTPRATVRLPAGVQYAWPHSSRQFLYVACSDGGPGFLGTRHFLCAYRVAPDGALTAHGAPITLASRPVHLSVDRESRYAMLTCIPSSILVYRIAADGSLGERVEQEATIVLEKTAHQLLLTPSNRAALVPCRGNPHHGTGAEDPGSLRVLDFEAGQLTPRAVLAPDGGLGFGPRHLDFHPMQPWAYMSIERQNEIALFRLDGETVSGPYFRTTTLERPGELKARQLGGAIHVHPDGRSVYVSNRADGTVEWNGEAVFNGAENTIAVFQIDPLTGRPTFVQAADTGGMHARTFAIGGDWLVVGNMTTRKVREGDTARAVPGGLTVFRIGHDGMLVRHGSHPLDVSRDTLFWMGLVELPAT